MPLAIERLGDGRCQLADRDEQLDASLRNLLAELVPGLLRPGDIVLVKGSLAVGLERVCRALANGAAAPAGAGA